MAGVELRLLRDSAVVAGAISNDAGDYAIERVAVGRYALQFQFASYRSRTIPDVVVTSSKTVVVDVDLEEMVVEVKAVTIGASKAGEAQNEMATVSERAFSVADAERYAGSRGAPARMASNFAGVQGTDDTRNDLVIRGNSPFG
jgi:Carboxypeptidase regulatory-like domain